MDMVQRNLEDYLWVRVSVPIASFGIPFAREYAESYPFPPPTTVYGMLLSYVGEVNRLRYAGTEITLALTTIGTPSVILRKTRRVKKTDLNSKENSRPDYQTLLSGLTFLVGLRDSEDPGCQGFSYRIQSAYQDPSLVSRYGGLSCGESHNLVDDLSVVSSTQIALEHKSNSLWVVSPDPDGEWSVPVWVDHIGSAATRWARVKFSLGDVQDMLPGLVVRPAI